MYIDTKQIINIFIKTCNNYKICFINYSFIRHHMFDILNISSRHVMSRRSHKSQEVISGKQISGFTKTSSSQVSAK